MNKVAILAPNINFTPRQMKQLSALGKLQLENPSQDCSILAIDPDAFGGFEKAKSRVTRLAKTLPSLKGLALSTTSYGWIDLEYFNSRQIPVCNIPGYSRESVAEHTLALMLGLAKRIMVTDRQTQRDEYKLGMGFELKDKTLGIIGLGNIGSRVAELALGIGMKVVAFNRSPRKQKGVKMVSLKQLFQQADAISLHVIDSEATKHIINDKALKLMRKGVIIINTVGREAVNELDMAKAIKSGKVYGYAYEAEDLEHTPLAKLENAVGIKDFGWYTKEALERLAQIWVDNVVAIAKGKPQSVVN